MPIRNVFAMLIQMQADSGIDQYVIGDGVGPTFYLEPVDTLDADVFITLALMSFRFRDELIRSSPLSLPLPCRGLPFFGLHAHLPSSAAFLVRPAQTRWS